MFIINVLNVANGSTLTIIIQFFKTNIFFKRTSQIKKLHRTKLNELQYSLKNSIFKNDVHNEFFIKILKQIKQI